MKKLFYLSIILVLALGSLFYYLKNKPVSSTKYAKSDVKIEAKSLLEQFEINESTANSLYLDKMVEVSGVVQEIKTNEGKFSVYFNSTNPMSTVIAEMESDVVLSQDLVGKNISVKGVCSGFLSDVVMVKCTLVK